MTWPDIGLQWAPLPHITWAARQSVYFKISRLTLPGGPCRPSIFAILVHLYYVRSISFAPL